jgi:hypothetical protein
MSKSRRWAVLALATGAVFAMVVAQALAATTIWGGAGTSDTVWKMGFKKVVTSGQPTRVKDWRSRQLRFRCTDNSTFRSSTDIHTPIGVRNGSFSKTSSFTNGNVKVTYTITGKFTSRTRANGTYKEKRALVSDPSISCASAQQPWQASKQ